MKPGIMILLGILLSLLPSELTSQDILTDSLKSNKKDSVFFRYKFNKGDTLRYYVVSHDSIVIDYDTPLLKRRFELIEITCDSVSKQGHFHLTQSLIQFLSTESKDEQKNIQRESSPWIGRKVHYEIDSLGKRYSIRPDDYSIGALSPGGAFQPYLFFDLGESGKAINESWMVESLDNIVENGVPVPLLRYTSLFRARDPLDTLDENCNMIEFIKTGQGSINLNNDGNNILLTNIINGYGKLLISIDKKIPIHFLGTIEQKLTIESDDGKKKPGWHYINAEFTLESFKPGKLNKKK